MNYSLRNGELVGPGCAKNLSYVAARVRNYCGIIPLTYPHNPGV